MKMVFIKFKPDGKEYGFGVPEDYKGSAGLKPWQLGAGPRPGVSQKDAAGGGARCRDRNAAGRVEDDRLLRAADCADCKQKSPPRRTSGRYHLPGKKGQSRKAGHAGRQADSTWPGRQKKRPGLRTIWTLSRIWPRGTTPTRACPNSPSCAWGCAWALMRAATMTRPCRCTSSRSAASHQLRDWAREQGLLPPMYYEDPVHGIDKNQLRELLIGIANGIMPRHLRPKAHQAAQVRSPCLA